MFRCSKELSHCEGSFEYPQYMFWLRNKKNIYNYAFPSADPEGGTGGPDPPGKSQVIWVSIGNKQLDHPLKKLDPSPPWKMLDSLWNLKKR